VKSDTRMILDTDTLTEVHRHFLPEAHRSADKVADLSEALTAEAEMTARLAAAERRALREEVQRRPRHEPLGWSSRDSHFIDAEPEARPRQPTNLGNRLLD
jgi:hypothetical protein